MYIHPQVRHFLDGIPDADSAPPIEEQRVAFSALWQSLAAPQAPGVSCTAFNFSGEAGDIPALVYVPEGRDEKLPVLLFLHGGGCCTLRPEDFHATSTWLAQSGECVVVVPAFRQAPENPFPAPLDDCVAVYRQLCEGGQIAAADATRIAVAGDSGGGYLAAALCLDAREQGLSQPLAQILLYPMLDMASKSPSRVSRDYFLDDAGLAGVIAMHAGSDLLNPRVSPLRAANLAGLARAYVIATSLDPLEDEARAYVEHLRAAGVDASWHRYEGMVHGFFSFGGIIDEGNDAVEHVAAMLRSTWRRAGTARS
ncbi:MAG: alpha/beta hydrolase [Halioglobus sp.]|nr:alpha/beta hydrolase [Halioglobus sp.]